MKVRGLGHKWDWLQTRAEVSIVTKKMVPGAQGPKRATQAGNGLSPEQGPSVALDIRASLGNECMSIQAEKTTEQKTKENDGRTGICTSLISRVDTL